MSSTQTTARRSRSGLAPISKKKSKKKPNGGRKPEDASCIAAHLFPFFSPPTFLLPNELIHSSSSAPSSSAPSSSAPSSSAPSSSSAGRAESVGVAGWKGGGNFHSASGAKRREVCVTNKPLLILVEEDARGGLGILGQFSFLSFFSYENFLPTPSSLVVKLLAR